MKKSLSSGALRLPEDLPGRKPCPPRSAAASLSKRLTPVGEHLKATHRGDLVIGDLRIPCAVLEDGRRVLTETGITTAILGRRSGASRRKKVAGTLLPLFIGHDRLKPFISEEFGSGPFSPVAYRDGSRQVVGYDATVLPAACEVWLRARDAGALHSQQAEKARRADLLMRSLAHVGIVALVDEATGYQEVRDRTASAF